MDILYDDSYHGVRFRYGLQYRSIASYLGCRDLATDERIPWILFSGRPSADPRCRSFGTFDCAVELSPSTCEQFSLVPLGMMDDDLGDDAWGPDSAQQRLERGPS